VVVRELARGVAADDAEHRAAAQQQRAHGHALQVGLGPGGHARGWSEHRWTRFALLAQSLAQAGESLGWSALRAPHAEPLPQQIERARHDAPLARSTAQAEHRRRRRATLLAHEAATLQGLLQALQTAEPALRRAAGAVPDAPGPPPELRQRPPL
jgi:hypothetical protein